MKLKNHYDSAADTVKDGLFGVLMFVGAVWGVFLLDVLVSLVPNIELNQWFDLHPRQLRGVIGIATMPFVHKNWVHIIGNTIPLVVLLTLLAITRPKSWRIVGLIIVLGGSMTWLFGDSQGAHEGSSGLVFGLITFLISSSLFEIFSVQRGMAGQTSLRISMKPRNLVPLAISILVGLLFGTSLLRGLVPNVSSSHESISWSGHWGGAIAGVLVAYWSARSWANQPKAARGEMATPEIPA